MQFLDLINLYVGYLYTYVYYLGPKFKGLKYYIGLISFITFFGKTNIN